MNEAEILARISKSRESIIRIGDLGFSLRWPTAFQERRFAMEFGDTPAGSQLWIRSMLLAGLVGWDGLTLDAVLHDGDRNNPLPFSPALAEALLDNNPELFDELSNVFLREREGRSQTMAAVTKNSVSASSGS